MRNTYKIIIISFCFIILAISIISFLVNLKNISVSQKQQFTKTIQLMDTVKIFTNNYGIPYIKANSDNDLFFAVGYFHAKERLWQMDVARRAGKGKLSEIFGEKTLKYDLFLRTLNLENTVRETKDVLSKKSLQILNSYTNGVNFYIQENKNKLSFEFGLLSYEPEEWTVDDCIIISKMMAFELSLGFYYDIAFGEMANSFGYDKAKKLIPSYPSNSPFVLDETVKTRNYSIPEISRDSMKLDSSSITRSCNSKFDNICKDDLKSIFQTIFETRDFLGMNGMSIGSNSWARNKSFNNKSAAILANDPHLPVGLPARWLPMHIQSDELNVFGFSIPGIPLVIIGRNNNIAWGITNVMLDDVDFFVEKVDNSGKYYFSNDSIKKEITYVLDTVNIRGKESYIYYKKFTERGQIISDLHIFNNEKNSKNKYLDKFSLTFRWVGNVANDDFINMYNINKAKNWQQFTEALNLWSAPALNFTYADKQGNIGIAPCGFIPIRDINCNPNFPNNAFENKTGWLGIAKGNVFGKLYNPQKRFVASANNKTADGIPYHITSFWEPPSRIERIEELLLISEEYSVRDAQYMQIDYYSMYAKQMFMYIIPILERYKNLLDSDEINIYRVFKKWDFVLNTESSEATIFNLFIERYLYNTFFDDLGEGYYKKYLLLSGIPLRKLMEITEDNFNIFFDNVKTSNVERRDYQIVKSFKEAIKKAQEIFKNTNYKSWKWGNLHTINLKHKLSEVDFVGSVVTVGPYPIGGNSTTINNTEYRIYNNYQTVIAPSVRFVADMGEDILYFSLPGGVSGDPLSPNYSNLVQIWLNGGYIKYYFNNFYSNDLNLSVVMEPILSEIE